jgi:6-phosphogluconate dehydrogenase
LSGPTPKFTGDREKFLENLEQALYASKIISYAQGFMLIQNAAKEYHWKLNKPEIALMWRGGCIIRSVFLKDITKAYRTNPELENLLYDDFFNKAIHKAQPGWREVVSFGALAGIPTPGKWSTYSFPLCQLTLNSLLYRSFLLRWSTHQRSASQFDSSSA